MSSLSCQFSYKRPNELLALNFINYEVLLTNPSPSSGSPSPTPTITPTPTPTASPTFSLKIGNTWGSNNFGQLGTGNFNPSLVPVPFGFTGGTNVFSGSNFNLAIKFDGTLWGWGSNNKGQLGNGTFTDSNVPIQIGTDNDWKFISCGNAHSFGIKNDDSLWAWGYNRFGQLGDNSTTDRNTPVLISSGWKTISAANSYSLGIKTNGTLFVWGNNFDGVFGNGTRDAVSLSTSAVPIQIGSSSDWDFASAGDRHVACKKTNGTVWTWGYNHQGQLGKGTLDNFWFPTPNSVFSDVSKLYCGQDTVITIRNDGTLWWWGYNFISLSMVSPIQLGVDSNWSFISCKFNHCLAIKTNGTLWAWGTNNQGQLGNGSTSPVSFPIQIGTTTSWVAVSTGGFHSFALY